jgi:hypothetical protein
MLGRRRRAPVAGYVVEDGAHLVQHAVALSQVPPDIQRYPCALVFAIAALHLLVHAFLYFALEDAGSGRLVVLGYLKDMRCVDPVVGTPAHDMVAVDIALIDGHLQAASVKSRKLVKLLRHCRGYSGYRTMEAHYARYCMSPNRSCRRARGAV